MKKNSIEKSFTNNEILKIVFQNYHVSLKAIKSTLRTFCGNLQNKFNVK